ncbi:cysteine sulfinate desulfinase [Bisgaardia hudsonensis]|uniref:Probable cysteine desulfurase n=1 Tax=Bisgaardia hudsonensis TaxID=109472 RepID=A0A4R2MWU9_9PAST|nr:cysteine desulfurase [Bisgaardia hudsonensis]QLB13293.1 cysteine desulfurase [Bisgaardia hudsonensis]TCP10961.1 cysteine sulfinate desulfinase [Bisgaardia hudsonensis]
MTFNPALFRQQFPFFIENPNIVYLDNAATTLKPQVLLDSTNQFYRSAGSVHRSQYDEQNTYIYEKARTEVKQLINAENENCIIWTSGTTHSINTVAYGLLPHLSSQDEIIISEAEHHANFVTWQQIAKKSGAKLRVLSLSDNWLINEQQLIHSLNNNTKLVALNFISNVTGATQAIKKLISLIRQYSNAMVLIDAAQAINHIKIDIKELDTDFLVFSAHKMYGPTGIGVLSGKKVSLEKLTPLLFGGKMVDQVSLENTSFSSLPYRLEAGTPNIAGVIGFYSVLKWLNKWDRIAAEKWTSQLTEQAKVRLSQYKHCKIFSSSNPSTLFSFVFKGIASSDLSTLLAEQNIALRVGEHCAQPYLANLNTSTTLRLSFAPYNNQEDVDKFFQALDKSLELLDIE